MQVSAMQSGNIYRPTEDADGRHRQLLNDLGNAVLQRAKSSMQHDSSTGKLLQLKCHEHTVYAVGHARLSFDFTWQMIYP